ncbi:toll/interleukin-1 receptor domain-containing protein [Rhodocaloribacter sp.]
MDNESDARREAFYDELETDIRTAIQQEQMQQIRRARMHVQVFLCHASEDKIKVMEVYRRIKAEGFKPWIDKEDLLPGQDWDREIRRVIPQSDIALAFFSKNSVSKRGYYQKELKLLLEVLKEMPPGQVFVIPVRLDECEIHEEFKRYQYADLFETNGLDKVIASITEHSKPAKPIRSPGSVHLDPVLQLIQGWSEVAKATEKEIHKLGLEN